MFVFGEPADVANLLVAEVASYAGPGLPRALPEDLSELGYEELRSYMIYCSSALRRATMNGLEEDVLIAVCNLYEKSLAAFCLLDDVIWRAMKLSEHNFPWNDPGAIVRQRAIVKAICEPSL